MNTNKAIRKRKFRKLWRDWIVPFLELLLMFLFLYELYFILWLFQ